ncbi:enoyl-CoA hydratase/isomerase family protein [Microbacterium sp. A93]|uniref:enoyl-CoA hydratase/isomerase family protein n=1 Tax=Microbacterium sp. A93 TaxID=3450716 RepID=UPI003F43D729
MPTIDDPALSWNEIASTFTFGDPATLPWGVRVNADPTDAAARAALRTAPLLTYSVDDDDPHADLSLTTSQLPRVLKMLNERPLTVITLALLLRSTEHASIVDAIAAESLAYSTLQAGPEYAGWLASRQTPTPSPDMGPYVQITDDGTGRTLVLNRPQASNAIDALTRAELYAAFRASAIDDAPLAWVGTGRHFCIGGDLAEFGLVESPAHGHISRMQQNLPLAVAETGAKLTARVHGAVIGAGMELSSFAHRVIASPDARWRLPEVKMGLLPGCGGTVSIPRRIGRQRTLLLTITGQILDAQTALRWGLVDEVTAP